MRLPDVNVLLYAHHAAMPEHRRYVEVLRGLVDSEEPFGLSQLVLSGFLRVSTIPGVLLAPSPMEVALEFVEELTSRPNARLLRPGLEHWKIFTRLLRQGRATGKLVADAYHAALAIEHGCEWLSADGDFTRFRGLRVRHPLA